MSAWIATRRGPVRPDSLNVLRGEATRKRILAAARKRIVANGFEALRLEDLARDAGVTKAAVVKSVGGKSAILLALAEDDRQTRLEVIDGARAERTGLARRLADVVRRLLELDAARARLVLAFAGHLWFWEGDDRARAQAMIDDTRERLSVLIAEASREPLSRRRLDVLWHRLFGTYATALRDVHQGRASVDDAVRFVVSVALD